MPKRASQQDHDRMVKQGADHLVQKNYRNVKADFQNWDKPGKITWQNTGEGHIPDLTGEDNPGIIVEVETSDSISHEHTADQWALFSAYARQYQKEFWVLIPFASKSAAEARIAELSYADDFNQLNEAPGSARSPDPLSPKGEWR